MGFHCLATGWAGEETNSIASYAEVDVLMTKGPGVFLKFDFYDGNIDLQGNALTRLTLGAELFPLARVELKPQLRYNENTVGAAPTVDLLLQFHAYI